MGVIIIIAVFWLLGLLMAWSMCVVAARADRRMEEIRHTHTDTDISRPALTELPQTGGLLGNTMIGVVVIAMAGGVAYLTVQSKRRREAHTL